ncbi:MAG: hypothetical protein FJ267_09075, partial [Planctomycetes bacterium]|nr:hypothetical protein [Planctomycetota bacterium]
MIRQSDPEANVSDSGRRTSVKLEQSKLTSFSTSAEIETEFDFDAFEAASLAVTREQFFRDCQGRSGTTLMVDILGKTYSWVIEGDQPSLIVGNTSDCELRIDDPQLPSRLCYLQWIDGKLFGFDIQQMKSSTNDRPPASIRIGQQPVQIGPCRFVLLDEAEEPARNSLPNCPIEKSTAFVNDLPQLRLTFSAVEQDDNHWPIDRPLTLIGGSSQCK